MPVDPRVLLLDDAIQRVWAAADHLRGAMRDYEQLERRVGLAAGTESAILELRAMREAIIQEVCRT